MQLLIVPIILGAGAIWFQSQASNTAERSETQRADAQLKIEDDRARQAALHTYLSSISTLLLDKNLKEATEENPVREIARATSLNTLRQLDSARKGLLITFLYDSGLVGFTNPPGERETIGVDPQSARPVATAPANRRVGIACHGRRVLAHGVGKTEGRTGGRVSRALRAMNEGIEDAVHLNSPPGCTPG